MTAAPKSVLYSSGASPERFAKLFASAAHVGVLDLEDGVPPPLKEQARRHLSEFMAREEKRDSLLAIRINDVYTRDGVKDLLMLDELASTPDVIVMTMVPGGSHVDFARHYVAKLNRAPKLFVTIERPEAISNIREIAQLADGLIFGSADYCASLGIPIGGWDNLIMARSVIVNAAAEAGIPAYDTACFNLNSTVALTEESRRAKALGFSGKTAVHPQQIAIINTIFTPSREEVAKAKRLVDFYRADAGIVAMNGEMVGPPFYKLAKRTLEQVT